MDVIECYRPQRTVLYTLLAKHPAIDQINLYGHQDEGKDGEVRYLDELIPLSWTTRIKIQKFDPKDEYTQRSLQLCQSSQPQWTLSMYDFSHDSPAIIASSYPAEYEKR